MLTKSTAPQQRIYQPSKRRVRQHVAAQQVLQPKPMNDSDVTFAARMVKIILILSIAYAFTPNEVLNSWIH